MTDKQNLSIEEDCMVQLKALEKDSGWTLRQDFCQISVSKVNKTFTFKLNSKFFIT